MENQDRMNVIAPNHGIEPILYNDNWFDLYQELESGSFDLVLTDPPFGILEKEGWDRSVAIDELETTIDHVLKDNGQCIMFCNLELLHRTYDELTLFTMRSYHVWHKTSAKPISRLMPLPDLEFILVLKRKGVKTTDLSWNPRDMLPAGMPYQKKSTILESPTRRHIKSRISQNEDGKRWVSTIIQAPNKPNMPKEERTDHPSQKSEELLRLLIRGYSNKGDIILDPFAGSGSTLISAYKEERRSMGVELNLIFYEKTQKRIEKITSQQELFINHFEDKSKKVVDTQA